jgi:hypothetical protein
MANINFGFITVIHTDNLYTEKFSCDHLSLAKLSLGFFSIHLCLSYVLKTADQILISVKYHAFVFTESLKLCSFEFC